MDKDLIHSKIRRIKGWLRKAIRYITNPHVLLCFGLAWLITNGWSYILLGIGTITGNEWMLGVAGAYVTFLWLPFTPEKIVTVALALLFLHILFPDDEKAQAMLKALQRGIRRRQEKKNASSAGTKDRERGSR